MSYWHTCPACCRDIARRRYDEPNRGTLCAHCEWSPLYRFAHDRGVADTVRAFWAAVCERLATGAEAAAAVWARRADDDAADGVRHAAAAFRRDAEMCRNRAAQRRAWAREGG